MKNVETTELRESVSAPVPEHLRSPIEVEDDRDCMHVYCWLLIAFEALQQIYRRELIRNFKLIKEINYYLNN